MNNIHLHYPVSGVFVPMIKIKDPVFSSKTLGIGFGINPTSNLLKSPIKGRVVQLHKSKHAITIESDSESNSGIQILLHIGIDTVTLRGEGFEAKVQVGDEVNIGQDLIEFDLDFIMTKGLDLTTILVCLNSETKDYNIKAVDEYELVNSSDNFEVITKSKNIIKSVNSNLSNSSNYKIELVSGMHARPAAKIAAFVKNSNSTVTFSKNNNKASATSIVSMLSLGIEKNDVITISALGDDSKVIIDELKTLLDSIAADELVSHKKESSQKVVIKKSKYQAREKYFLKGVLASDGIAIGNVVYKDEVKLDFSNETKDKDLELIRLNKAIEKAVKTLNELESDLVKQNENSKAAIFNSQKEILQDKEIQVECSEVISGWKSAEFAWSKTIDKRIAQLEALNNELISARANDLKDIKIRVLKILIGINDTKRNLLDDSIVIADDLTPSDIINFDLTKVIGFATIKGGATSHVAILARSMGLPAIAALDEKALKLKNNDLIILDANEETLICSPTDSDITIAKSALEKFKQKMDLALQKSKSTTYSLDKKRIKVVANISSVSDAQKATELGAEGVGLLRTEFIFLGKKSAPTQSEQVKIYQDIVDNLDGNELVLRTLDIGGDKQLSYLPIANEENPFLGLRGIRFCLRNEGIFREQLRAVLSVNSKLPINVMFPMVGHLNELLKAKEILEDERVKLNAPRPNVGIMVEVPSAALMAEVFAPHVDFFSIGTNDLTQYTLATDRGHSELAADVDGLDPSVLKLIHITCVAAQKNNIWVGVCGGIASDLKAIPVLLGLGVDELSVSMPSVPIVKETVRQLNVNHCKENIHTFLNASSAKEVRDLISTFYPSI